MYSSQSEEDCKYKHLLQPIRDLAANWDINIANDLEEYLVSRRFVVTRLLQSNNPVSSL